jgi:glutathione S-transferase
LKEHKSAWGWYDAWMGKHLVPVMYWRIWHKMGFRVLKETGYSACSPREALIKELEAWQTDGGKKEGELFGGSKPNIVDIWMYGQLNVFRHESLFKVVESNCPTTIKWMTNVEKFF